MPASCTALMKKTVSARLGFMPCADPTGFRNSARMWSI
ncbi:hypothetical protein EVA_07058 [gut metagenome]|uniref:Uncharacterized protein n=1 Tax=gut metagenome TaxID=749906 RepID=J9GQR6_9ZZZZ